MNVHPVLLDLAGDEKKQKGGRQRGRRPYYGYGGYYPRPYFYRGRGGGPRGKPVKEGEENGESNGEVSVCLE